MERRLLFAIVVLLALQLIVQVVPGPFCNTPYSPESIYYSCAQAWWPVPQSLP